MLPSLTKQEQLVKQQVVQFAGYDHNAVPRDGYLYDMKNLSGDLYPVLSPRRGRTLVRAIAKPNGLFAAGRLCWVDGTEFFYDGVKKGTVADGKKSFARLGAWVLIFPDKAYYNTATDTFGALEARWSGTATITSHTYDAEGASAEEVYQGNAITTTGAAFPFEAGEAVFLTGSGAAENNRSAVIREVLEGGKKLVFSNNTFTEHATQALTLERRVPDMDFFCENENRLWGCRGNEIYASALGNPFRWNNYEGLATDSYAVTVGSEGDFTGACSFLGYAMFFKPDMIHKVYGGKPSNFQAMASAVSGVAAGGGESMAVAGEMLFYLCRTGVTSYSGGIPVSVAAPFGPVRFDEAVGGSDGRNYYVSLREGEAWSLFAYDTRTGLWHKEDGTHALGFACQDGVLYLLDAADNGLYAIGTGGYEGIEWVAETGDFTDAGPDKAGVGKLLLRLEADQGSRVKVEVQFDSDGVWRPVKELANGEAPNAREQGAKAGAEAEAQGPPPARRAWVSPQSEDLGPVAEGERRDSTRKRTYLLPIIPRRCDHYRLRLSGTGGCRVFSLTRQFYRGSEL